MINKIQNINNYPDFYKGIGELIIHLIEIQKEDLENAFSDIKPKIIKEIFANEENLNKFPRECQNQEDFSKMFKKCIKNFSENLKNKLERLESKEDDSPKENLMKYYISLKFKEHIEKTKIKMSELLSLSFSMRKLIILFKIIQIKFQF